MMSMFVLIHGAGDGGWAWHLVEAELRKRGHSVVAPDLPADDDTLTLTDYADAVVDAAVDNMGKPRKLIVVGHSFGGFTAPLVADRLPADMLVLLAGMIPSPGEPPDQWWDNTGYPAAIVEQAQADGGLAGNPDPYVSFPHDVPRELAEEATSRERAHPSATATSEPVPLDAWPHVPTRFVLCSEDRFFPPSFLRRVARDRLGISPDEIAGSHCVPLGRPSEVADILVGYTWPAPTCRTASEHLFTGLSSGFRKLGRSFNPRTLVDELVGSHRYQRLIVNRDPGPGEEPWVCSSHHRDQVQAGPATGGRSKGRRVRRPVSQGVCPRRRDSSG